MSTERGISKIIWAVDPYLNNEDSQNRIVDALLALASPLKATISPVAVMVSEEATGEAPFLPGIPKELHSLVEKRLETFLKATKLPKLLDPIVLTYERDSIRGAVNTILRHAHDFDGDLIAVSTHSRKGPERFLMGSFAETLLLHSDIPTLSVGPHSRPVGQIQEVLFPTDFTEKSLQALDKVLPLVNALGAKLLLFHHFDLFYSTYYPMDPTPAYFKAMEEQEIWAREKGESLVKKAKELGVNAEFTSAKGGVSTTDTILEFANRMKSGIIAMASQTGPIGSALLGSVTRQVVRAAPWPVWVLHPGGRP